MRLWPFERRQADQINATDVLVDQLTREARGENINSNELLVSELAASIWGRAFAAANLSGDAGALLDAGCMAMTARALAKTGEIVFIVDADAMMPVPAFGVTITGQASPTTWMYKLNLPGPSSTEQRTLPGSQILHFKIGVDAKRPWRGQSPLVAARAGAASLSLVEKSFQDALKIPTGTVVSGGSQGRQTTDQIGQITATVVNHLHNGMVFLADDKPVSVEQIRPNFDATQIELRAALINETLAAFGISPVMLNPVAPATSLREGTRLLLNVTLKPISKMIAREVERKLGMELKVDFSPLATSDIAGQARAVAALTKSGMAIEQALVEAGIVEGGTQ